MLRNSNRLFQECKWTNELGELSVEEIEASIMVIYHMLNKLYVSKTRLNYTTDNITIYTTDLDHVTDLMHESGVSGMVLSVIEANVSIPQGTIFRKRSKYKYRISLKQGQLGTDQRNDLTQFFKTYDPMVKVSGSLRFLLYYTSLHTVENYHFFDTDDKDLAIMLDLIGLKSKVVRIISDKYDTGD